MTDINNAMFSLVHDVQQNQWRKKIMKKGKKWRRKENEKKGVAGWI